MYRMHWLIMLAAAAMILVSCGGSSGSPLMPDTRVPDLTSNIACERGSTSKALWGFWEVTFDYTTMDLTAVPFRGVQYTVDVVTFLQPPTGNPANLQISVTDVTNWFDQGLIDVEVGLRHPFPGLDMFTGFDVMGVFMSPGSVSGHYDTDVVYPNGIDEGILLNADGYTRWMNPEEFPDTGTILDFTPGNLSGSPTELFTCTINGYKYFADNLDTSEDLYDYFITPDQPELRGLFSSGNQNWREYQLKFPMVDDSPSLVFQYAVIASWVEPDMTLSGDPDLLDVPDDFPASANADEAVNLEIVDNSTVWYVDGNSGGSIILDLEIYDWGAYTSDNLVANEIHKIVIDGGSVIPGNYAEFDQASLMATAVEGSSAVSSVFSVEISGITPTSDESIPLLITIESEAPEAFDPGTGTPNNDDRLAAYFIYNLPVNDEEPLDFAVTSPNGGETLWMALYHEITWIPNYTGVTDVIIEWSTDDFVSDVQTIIDSTENDGSFTWLPIPSIETSTAKIRITDVLGVVSDESDDYFTLDWPVWLDFQDEVEVISGDTVTFSYETYLKDYDEFSTTLCQEADGTAHIVWHSLIYASARETPIRSTDGDNWTGEGGCFFTGGGTTNIREDCMKLCTTPTTVFGLWQHWSIFFSGDADHFPNGHSNYNHTNNLLNDGPHVDLEGEIMADDQYIYEVGDQTGPGIYSVRIPDPGYGSWPMFEPKFALTNYGEISHSRSWDHHAGTMVLAYYTLSNQIKLLKQTSQPTNTWDDSEIIFDGATYGYSNSKHPSIWADESDRLFCAWLAQDDVTGDWHLLAAMKDSPTGTWTDPVLVDTSTEEFEDIHITANFETVELPTGDTEYPLVIGYEKEDVICSKISPKDLWAFLPNQQVSADGDITRDPDTLAHWGDLYQYDVLFAWSFEVTPGELGIGNYDVKFRNSDFMVP